MAQSGLGDLTETTRLAYVAQRRNQIAVSDLAFCAGDCIAPQPQFRGGVVHAVRSIEFVAVHGCVLTMARPVVLPYNGGIFGILAGIG